ncbi:M15 family metallopeptidase [Agromyces atrinae]|uniref:D-alanyl-D-alanine carboxypeptidase n=1 Tax=Agromyces atrinae TaxID=592376 RepID=A0A852SI08_9MICO|nr:M15 family metallopeptidase [Agromyces atrinae]NYD67491.1 D-alanyl-D-alanine carboxypeptidase [Agromyces atrinae]
MAETRGRQRASRRVRRNRTIAVASVLVIGGLVAGALALGGGVLAGTPKETPAAAPETQTPTPDPTRPAPGTAVDPAAVDTFDRNAHSLDDPASIWVVVNRARSMPSDYVPPDLVDVPIAHTNVPVLRQEASDAVVAMANAARDEAGLELASNSAYRSYDTQVGLYGDGSDPTTAPPGASEHQTGFAIDIGAASGECSLNTCMADTAEGIWLRDNAWRFGFLLRYPAEKVDITGYPFEPWHFRYVGVDLSTEMHDTGFTTLEEFFGLPAAPM